MATPEALAVAGILLRTSGEASDIGLVSDTVMRLLGLSEEDSATDVADILDVVLGEGGVPS